MQNKNGIRPGRPWRGWWSYDPSCHENGLLAETWFFEDHSHSLEDDRDFSDVLNASKQQLESSLSIVSVISWAAFQKSEPQHLSTQRIEGFVHYGSSNRIRLGCLKRVMPEKSLSGTGKIIQAVQNSAPRKQAGAAGRAPAACKPLALQRLLRVVGRKVTRERDSRPPPPLVPWCLQLHLPRYLCAPVGSFWAWTQGSLDYYFSLVSGAIYR